MRFLSLGQNSEAFDELLDAFTEAGITAWPNMYSKGWISVPLHYQNKALPIAEKLGGRKVPGGFAPKDA